MFTGIINYVSIIARHKTKSQVFALKKNIEKALLLRLFYIVKELFKEKEIKRKKGSPPPFILRFRVGGNKRQKHRSKDEIRGRTKFRFIQKGKGSSAPSVLLQILDNFDMRH